MQLTWEMFHRMPDGDFGLLWKIQKKVILAAASYKREKYTLFTFLDEPLYIFALGWIYNWCFFFYLH